MMLAFHGSQEVKASFLERVVEHRKMDDIRQSFGYYAFDDRRNRHSMCAVGCTIHGSSHAAYETELGIPQTIARLEDCMFEGLPVEDAKRWPEEFLAAIPVGADLSLVFHRFSAWLLRSDLLTVNDCNSEAIDRVATLHERTASGETVAIDEWRSAAESARSAAESARSAAESAESAAESAESAAESARSARSARSAAESARSARSAESAAWSAAWSAAESARSVAWKKMAGKLLELLASSPVIESSAMDQQT